MGLDLRQRLENFGNSFKIENYIGNNELVELDKLTFNISKYHANGLTDDRTKEYHNEDSCTHCAKKILSLVFSEDEIKELQKAYTKSSTKFDINRTKYGKNLRKIHKGSGYTEMVVFNSILPYTSKLGDIFKKPLTALIVGGIAAGITAATELASPGFPIEAIRVGGGEPVEGLQNFYFAYRDPVGDPALEPVQGLLGAFADLIPGRTFDTAAVDGVFGFVTSLASGYAAKTILDTGINKLYSFFFTEKGKLNESVNSVIHDIAPNLKKDIMDGTYQKTKI